MEQESKEEFQKEVVKVVNTKEYIYNDGECKEFKWVHVDGDKEKNITNYRQTQLLQNLWKPKSQFIKMYTGGHSRQTIPQFEPKGFAQYYLNTTEFLKPEENCLGKKDERGKWYNFTREQYQEALKLKRNTFDRFMKFCLDNNILSVYGRNEDVAIYLNPIYMFNGRQLHINLCLAFDHDNKFLRSLTDMALKEYLRKKQEVITELRDISS